VIPLCPSGDWTEEDSWTAINWYEAARVWNKIVKSKEMAYWAQLKPGRPLSESTYLTKSVRVTDHNSLRQLESIAWQIGIHWEEKDVRWL
jgi:hypothetical protein